MQAGPGDGPMSAVMAHFKLDQRGSNVLTEVRAAMATFATMCYILAVNARLLAESGGPCQGDIFGAEYLQCTESFRRQIITATALSSMLACLMMGFGANLPFALAPGMGLNAYFTYDVVGWRGTGKVSWDVAITAVFIEGIIFVILAMTGLRIRFAKLMPESIKIATTGGIGLFLAHLGLQTAEGMGVVVSDIATGLTLGGCTPEHRSYVMMNSPGAVWPNPGSPSGVGGVIADAYTCDNEGGKMQSATTWLSIVTLFLITYMLKHKVRGALIAGIVFATIVSWIPGTLVSYWSNDVYPMGGTTPDNFDGGEYRYNYFKQVVGVEGLDMVAFKFNINFAENGADIALAVFTFFYVDFFDTTGTLFAMAKYAGLTDSEGNFEGDYIAFIVDGLATSMGACLGVSPVTTYIETAAGLEEGGKTGLTAIIIAFFFFLSIFFAPLLASVPPWATGPALVIVGALMMSGISNIKWNKHGEAVPAFLTMILMPLTYSVAYGIIAGLFSWIVINVPDELYKRFSQTETIDLEDKGFLSGIWREVGKDAPGEDAKNAVTLTGIQEAAPATKEAYSPDDTM